MDDFFLGGTICEGNCFLNSHTCFGSAGDSDCTLKLTYNKLINNGFLGGADKGPFCCFCNWHGMKYNPWSLKWQEKRYDE